MTTISPSGIAPSSIAPSSWAGEVVQDVTGPREFEGRVALVTGAGGGIGLAVVERFAAAGATIVAADVSAELAAPALETARAAGVPGHALPGDLLSADYCDSLPGSAREVAGGLDFLINNAGLIRRGNILETSDEDWHLSMAVNVEAVFRLSRAAIGLMAAGEGGALVNVASCWGLYPGRDHLAYCTSKAAVAAMTRCLGRDHAGDGVRVNAVCPIEVNTPMLRSGFEKRGFDPETAIAALNATVPLGHIAEPAEIADVVHFLASDAARHLCGACIEVTGGKAVE